MREDLFELLRKRAADHGGDKLLEEAAAALEAAREDAERLDALRLANAITKALFPDLYGKPGLNIDQVALLMGSRGIIHDVLRGAIDQARGIVPEAGQGVKS